MRKAIIVINRHKVKLNKKHNKDDPCISIRTYNKIEYAREIELIRPECETEKEQKENAWILKQDFNNPVCSGATIWLEGKRENVRIIRK